MIVIRTIEELESERERQLKAWIENGKEEDEFCLSLEGADLEGAYLICSFFYRANFAWADLRGANLQWADLHGAYLPAANLSGANLANSHFRSADFMEANLSNANLTEADLTNADLTDSNLSGADLTGANLDGADLKGAKISDTIITQSQYDELYRLYSHEVMGGFIIKELEVE